MAFKQFFYIFISLLCFSSFAQEISVEERLNQLEAKLLDLEYNQAVNKLQFSGSFLNHYENYYADRKRDDSVIVANDEDTQNAALSVFLMRVDLNFDVRISKDFRFFSTLGMSKYWNLDGREARVDDESENFNSLGGGYRSTGSEARFDTAYLRYKKKGSLWSFALGRMTTNGGPPINQLDGLDRSGTYPLMTYNVVLDGAAFIYDLSRFMPRNHKLKLRVFYTPFMSVDLNDKARNRSDSINDTDPGPVNERGARVDSNASFVTLLTEYHIQKLSWLKSLDIYHAYFTVDKTYYKARQNTSDEDIEYESGNASIFYLGFNSLFGTGLNLSFTHSSYFLRSDIAEENSVSNYYLNSNYRFDNSINRGHILGFEYIQHDEFKLPTDYATLQVTPFYDLANGEGYHLFYTMPFGKSHIVRLGAYKYKVGGSVFFLSNVSEEANAFYARWKVFF